MYHFHTDPRILVIDDNQDIHTDFQKILKNQAPIDDELLELDELFSDAPERPEVQQQQIQIDSAYQGQEGFEKVKASLAEGLPYSLAFVDVRMPPGWDGIKTVQKIWEVDPDIQVVICSAYSDYSWQEIINELKHTSRFLVLKKPFESIEVRQLVSTLHQRWYDARHDALTGLVNRRAFMDHFQRQKSITEQQGTQLSCVMIDLDFFKRVNDDHGHSVGDEALCTVAKILHDNSRPGDIVSRYGGEELCVLLKNADEKMAFDWADRVRQTIANTRVAKALENPIFITSSFGVCEFNTSTMTLEQAMDGADRALRMAKDLGRNQVVTHQMVSEGCVTNSESQINHVFDGVHAKDVMNPMSLVQQEVTLKEALNKLLNDGTTSAPVINAEGEITGQLTERDILQSLMAQQLNQTAVQDVMTSVVCYPESTALQEIFEFLVRVSIPQVVVTRDGRPIGVIARRSLLKWLLNQGFSTEKQSEPLPIPVTNSNLPEELAGPIES